MNTYGIRYFASVRELLGHGQEQISSNATTVGQLRQELIGRGEPYASVLAQGRAVRVAVNQVMANDDTPITGDAEVAFFPPVTGG